MQKAELRQEIRRLTDKYLMSGREIEVLPPKRFLAPSCGWMEKYGWDYMPWVSFGSAGGESSGDSYWLGDGGYLTKPRHMED